MTQKRYITDREGGNEAPVFLKDKYAVKILRDERNRDYLLKIICAAIGISEESLNRDFEVLDIRLGNSAKVVAHEADMFIRNDKIYINLEVNRFKSKVTDYKNLSYICEIILRQQKKGKAKDNYKNLKKVYQINLNSYDYFKNGNFIYTSSL